MVTRPRNLPQADPYFDSVVLLAPFSGEDGDTSSTDLSNEAHTMTFNANSVLDGDIRKFGFTSAKFDGAGDYISIPDALSLSPESVSFTVECDVRFNGDPTTDQHTFVGKWVNGQVAGTNKEWWVGYRNNKLNAFLSSNGTNGIFMADVVWDPAGDTWYHIAFVFDRELATNETRVYVDGTQVGSSDTTLNTYASFFNSTADVWIGGYDADTNDWMDGWIENVRITKGVARYTSTFTPPERAYPTVQNLAPTDPNFDSVVLLLPFDGADAATTTTDLSNEGHTMTFAANASLDSDIRKFGSTSCFFDDTINGKGVYTTTNAAWANLKIADGFTVEAHVNYSQNPTNTLVSMWSWTQGSTTRSWGVFLGSDGAIIIYVQDSASTLTQNFTTASSLLTASIWHHVVFQCQPAGNFEVFVDGTRVANVTPTITELRDPTDDFCVGATDDSVDELGGHVDNVRITKGIARYTDGFTPPTAPHPTS